MRKAKGLTKAWNSSSLKGAGHSQNLKKDHYGE